MDIQHSDSIIKQYTLTSYPSLYRDVTKIQKEIQTHIHAFLPKQVLPEKSPILEKSILQTKYLSEKDINSIVDNFREDFGYENKGAWGEYKECPIEGCDCVLSIQDVYNLEEGKYIPLKKLEEAPVYPYCQSHTSTLLVDSWPREKLKESFQKKYVHNETARGCLLRDGSTIVATTIGYASTFEQAWKYEFEELFPELEEEFLARINEHSYKNDSTLFSRVYVWNLLAVSTEYRTPIYTKELLLSLCTSIPLEYYNDPILCEVDIYNPFTALLMTFGAKILCNSHQNPRTKLAILAPSVRAFINNIRSFYTGDATLKNRYRLYRQLQKEQKINTSQYSSISI